jgi:hypothetical protein
VPLQRAEAETPRADVPAPGERPRQLAESPAPRKEIAPRAEPKPEQYAERVGRPGYQYWIQVGAHKDESISRAEWAKIQNAAGPLAANAGNRIQRADLGARGVYYRVQIGPFASPTEASQFCAQLKARSVDCFLAAPEVSTASTQTPEKPAPPKVAAPLPKPVAKPAEPKPVAKPAELKPVAKPAETMPAEPKAAAKPTELKPVAKPAETKPTELKPVAKPVDTKPAEPRPVAKPAETKPAAAPPLTVPAEKKEAAMPKRPAEAATPPPLPEQKPTKTFSAEKPDAPISTAPGLPGVLD